MVLGGGSKTSTSTQIASRASCVRGYEEEVDTMSNPPTRTSPASVVRTCGQLFQVQHFLECVLSTSDVSLFPLANLRWMLCWKVSVALPSFSSVVHDSDARTCHHGR